MLLVPLRVLLLHPFQNLLQRDSCWCDFPLWLPTGVVTDPCGEATTPFFDRAFADDPSFGIVEVVELPCFLLRVGNASFFEIFQAFLEVFWFSPMSDLRGNFFFFGYT